MPRTLRLAVAQSTVAQDPGDVESLRAGGAQVRRLMREAKAGGARLVQFPEGAIVYPDKHVMSSQGPDVVADADWSRADWSVLREEADSVTALAGELGLWVAFGSIHPLEAPRRPLNSLYVVSDRGEVVGRYDKRVLSHTERTWMYTPGTQPLVFEVDGFRFGVALCVEAGFPELFDEYERLDVHCVLLSVMADDAARALIGQSYAALHCYWVGYSIPAQYAATVPSGIVAPGGRWLARCEAVATPGLAFADLDLDSAEADIDGAVRLARPWRRSVRDELRRAGVG
ncbi:carbon-nitrogen hydrolase family protein [Nocardioides lijunqiniae]|uniref:carbon-nitrogen hydrolase family protein n=1 Tax=Nocardioides lijunqiniae TaxID=2760832 RepID=UPI0018776E48|nr:carbon-nitrogen hydrolase family protein [Nocardioides lijunqiniae]